MIGLEYILNLYNMQHTELAEELGIKKQNINMWIKGKQNIPKKYLPTLEELFGLSREYFIKELDEIDQLEIQKEKLEKDGIGTRVISVPCMEIFDKQDKEYKESILPNKIRNRVSIEAGATQPWYKYVGLDGIAIGIDRFGESGPGAEVYKHLNIGTERVYEEVKKLLNK